MDAISAARVMILVFSASSNHSPQVRREVERAVHKQLSILPFRIEDVLPSKSLEFFLSTQHWMDAFPPPREAALRAVVRLPQDSVERSSRTGSGACGGSSGARSAPAFDRLNCSTSSGSWPDTSDRLRGIW